MLKNVYPLTDTMTFAESTTYNVDIPDSGYITEINVLFNLRITSGTSISQNEDSFPRMIDAARLTAAGAKNYFDISDGRQWYYWNYMNYEGQIMLDSLPSAGSSSDVKGSLVIHWGLDPYVDTDRTIILPSPELQNTKLEITWAAATALGTGFTITAASSNAKLEITELALEPGELRESIWKTLVTPRFEAKETTISSTASNLSKEIEVPVGDILYQTLIMVLNSSGNKTSTDVSELGVKYPKERRTPFKRDVYSWKGVNRRKFRLPAPDTTHNQQTGVGLLNWSELTDKEKGIDLRGAQVGDVKTAYTVATSGGTIHELHYAFG